MLDRLAQAGASCMSACPVTGCLCSAGTALRCAEDESVRPWSHLNGFKFPSSAKCDRDGPAEDQDGAYVKPPLDRRA